MDDSLTPSRRTNPWLVMVVIHAIGLGVTAALFVVAAVTEGAGGAQAHAMATGWAMAGIVLAPLVTMATVWWWYSGREKEALPARPEPKPYDGLPATTSSLQRVPASV